MALARRSGSRFEANIWPGFVDAMTALLLVLMFVLSIFMIVQFVLRDRITGQDRELQELSIQVSGLARALGLEKQRAEQLDGEVGALRSQLSDTLAEAEAQSALVASLSRQRNEARQRIASIEEQVASLLAENRTLTNSLSIAEAEIAANGEEIAAARVSIETLEDTLSREITAKEAAQIALAQARDEVSAQEEAAALAAARREALEALIASLEAEAAARETEIGDLQSRMDATAQALFLAERARDEGLVKLSELQAAQLASAEALSVLEEQLSAEQMARIAVLAELEAARDRSTELLSGLNAAEQRANNLQADLITAEDRITAAELALAEKAQALSEEEKARLAEAAAAEALREKLANASAELTAMTLALEEERKRAEDTLTLLAAAETAKDELEGLHLDAITEIDRQKALLLQAQELLSNEREVSLEGRREIALLNQQTSELNKQLNALQALLDESREKDESQQVQLETLGRDLNAALARVAAEERLRRQLEEAERIRLEEEAKDLRNYRSEFFGRIREILGDREGVEIVGDRFVFSSEILFAPASAELGLDGQFQISRVAAVIREVSREIPEEINWILRVDGHTDRTPLGRSFEFDDNWDLSQARALSVVRYLVDFENIPPSRLAATGFGEFQPIDPADTDEAYARNRRIEIKLTER